LARAENSNLKSQASRKRGQGNGISRVGRLVLPKKHIAVERTFEDVVVA
jgi:hypothetical protein